MVKTAVRLCDLTLENPIIPASGTFGFGYEFSEFYDINILGSISLKGCTKEPRYGNPTPRIAECPAGILNSVGLQNPGIDEAVNTEYEKLKLFYDKPIIQNISGFSVEEFAYCALVASKSKMVGIIEVNVSCPNVHGGGAAFGTDPDRAYEVVRAVREVSDKPIFVKLSPNVTDVKIIAKACAAAGADGFTLINTLGGMRIDLKTKRPVLNVKSGGYSGRGVFPVAIKMIYELYETLNLPIMGVGGVSSAEEAIEMMLAGATAVQVGTANLINPYACKEIIEGLPKVMEKYKIDDLSKIIGGAH